jgi:hypothetical protein
MNKIIAGTVSAMAVIAAVAACGSSGPPNATSVLQSNGYTPVTSSSLSPSALASSVGAGNVSSAAIGVSTSNGSEYQMVMVLTPAALSQGTPADITTMESQAASAGVKASLNGDVLTMTGTQAAFGNLPSS